MRKFHYNRDKLITKVGWWNDRKAQYISLDVLKSLMTNVRHRYLSLSYQNNNKKIVNSKLCLRNNISFFLAIPVFSF